VSKKNPTQPLLFLSLSPCRCLLSLSRRFHPQVQGTNSKAAPLIASLAILMSAFLDGLWDTHRIEAESAKARL